MLLGHALQCARQVGAPTGHTNENFRDVHPGTGENMPNIGFDLIVFE